MLIPGYLGHPSFEQMNQAGPLLVVEVVEAAVEEQIVQAQVASEGRQTWLCM